MNEHQQYLHWRTELDSNQILWLYFDKKNSNVNTIDSEVIEELDQIITYITHEPTIKGVVIASAKSSGFIAGADIEQFTRLKTVDEAKTFIQQGQTVFSRLAQLAVPTVAMIEGFCLGGGLELALACTYRVAEDGAKTRLGLPEVLLGIHPGWGGSVRLSHKIGAIKAMELILSGRTVSAKEAAKLGFVDDAVPKRHLHDAACSYILEQPSPHMPTLLEALSNAVLIRPLVGKFLEKKLAEKVKREHYPAPYAVLENWVRFGASGEAALTGEVNSIAQMMTTDTAKNLIRVFFLQERMKGLAKGVKFEPKHIHIAGAGVMGGDIAAWCALRGLSVTLQDKNPAAISRAIKRASSLFIKQLKHPRLVQEASDRLCPDKDGYGIATADVIIEAIFENLQAKQELLQSIESQMKPEALLATNTSSIPLDELNTVLKNPERLVGIHYFNPVAKMRLVEVVHGKVTHPEITKRAMAFVRKIDRLPLPTLSKPGFLVNRILMPYLMESIELYSEGIPAPFIDKAAVDFGMPMGPIELADTVGLDICLSVAEILLPLKDETVPPILKEMVNQGKLGKKSGQGFYTFKNGKIVKQSVKEYPAIDTITDRLILRMLNEAMACLREKIVPDGDLLDAGMIFGTGFAPFRGGPIQYIRTTGVKKLKDRLLELEQLFGNRFKPDPAWDTFAHEEQKSTITT